MTFALLKLIGGSLVLIVLSLMVMCGVFAAFEYLDENPKVVNRIFAALALVSITVFGLCIAYDAIMFVKEWW